MKPTTFPEANHNWQRPASWTAEQCGSLPAYRTAELSISCWRASWRERLAILLTGRVWLWVHMGGAQPPVALAAAPPFDRCAAARWKIFCWSSVTMFAYHRMANAGRLQIGRLIIVIPLRWHPGVRHLPGYGRRDTI